MYIEQYVIERHIPTAGTWYNNVQLLQCNGSYNGQQHHITYDRTAPNNKRGTVYDLLLVLTAADGVPMVCFGRRWGLRCAMKICTFAHLT